MSHEKPSKAEKQRIRKEQNYCCADCGIRTYPKKGKLEIHHKKPVSQGGNSKRENLVGLCGEQYNDCHEKWDRLALDEMIYFDDRVFFESDTDLHS